MQPQRFMLMKAAVVVGAILLFFGGFLAGRRSVLPSVFVTDVYNKDAGKPENIDFEPFWKAWSLINERYVGTETTDPQDKVWGAIEGLAASLGDPYTVFFPPEEAKSFEELISGSFGGVGMEIGEREGLIVVIAPLKDTPAERAGIRPGDAILSINGTSTSDMSVDEAVSLIRGEPRTVVVLELFREGETKPRTLSVTRDTIIIPTLDTELRTDGIFVISLYNFDANAVDHFDEAMAEFVRSGSDKLILDLRGNPGGFLDAAVDIAGYFLPAGDVVVRESSDGKGEETAERSSGSHLLKNVPKMVILVNKGSASASEILAGALQEHGVAKLVGEQTFGKGSVQELLSVTRDTSLKLTIAQWLTPKGVSISKAGLTPDVVVERSEEDFLAGKDPQLETAVGILLKQ